MMRLVAGFLLSQTESVSRIASRTLAMTEAAYLEARRRREM
jgi:hypothetical protein